MAEKDRDFLRTLFQNGEIAYADDFGDLIDSTYNKIDDDDLLSGDGGDVSINGDLTVTGQVTTNKIQAETGEDLSLFNNGGKGIIINEGDNGDVTVEGQVTTNKIQAETGEDLSLFNNGGKGIIINDGGNVGIGTGATVIQDSAIFEIKSTTQGFLPPRMKTGEVLTIESPVKGLHAFDTDLNKPRFFDGSDWVTLVTETGASVTAHYLPLFLWQSAVFPLTRHQCVHE